MVPILCLRARGMPDALWGSNPTWEASLPDGKLIFHLGLGAGKAFGWLSFRRSVGSSACCRERVLFRARGVASMR